jgi:hypothetical protein
VVLSPYGVLTVIISPWVLHEPTTILSPEPSL